MEDAPEIAADAQLVIRDAANLDEDIKLQMAEWLRQHAEDLLSKGHEYAPGFVGKFNPDEQQEGDEDE